MSDSERSLTLKVSDVLRETEDAVSIVFDREPGFAYKPGQFLTLRIPSDLTGSVARCYSLASSPHRDEAPRVIVKRTVEGFGSNWLCDNVKPGVDLEVLRPSGIFTPRTLEGDVLLFAAGSGITPILSIAKSVLVSGSGFVRVFYANRDQDSVIAAGELRELEAEFSGRLTVTHWLESLQGLPRQDALVHLVGTAPGHTAFACGPEPFMDAVRTAWQVGGRSHDDLHLEAFVSLSGDPFSEPDVVIEADPSAKTAPLVVGFEGDDYSFDWPFGVSLVDFLVSRAVEVPYMCRDGECGTCLATCSSGAVEMRGGNLLDESDIANGDVLACQLYLTGDEPVRVVF